MKQATLHNFDFIHEKDIRIGDRVRVKRAGDVIPYVIGPMKSVRTGREASYSPPECCPVCGEPVEHLEGEVDAISSSTDYLLRGEDPGSKLDRARELGVSVIREEDLRGLLST